MTARDEVACDLCIAGAGAAGITLALAFGGRAARVVVLESGGFELRAGGPGPLPRAATSASRTSISTPPGCASSAARPTTGAACARRSTSATSCPGPWVPHSGWPIRRTDLAPFYPARTRSSTSARAATIPPCSSPTAACCRWRPSASRRGCSASARRRPGSARSIAPSSRRRRAVELWLHANLVDIELGGDGRAEAFVVRSLAGKRARVRARLFVLALGGIENARLLLSCDRQIERRHRQPARSGRALLHGPPRRRRRPRAAHRGRAGSAAYLRGHHPQAGGHEVQHALAPSDALQRTAAILNSAAAFGEVIYERPRSEGYGALHDIKEGVRERRLPDDFGANLWRVRDRPRRRRARSLGALRSDHLPRHGERAGAQSRQPRPARPRATTRSACGAWPRLAALRDRPSHAARHGDHDRGRARPPRGRPGCSSATGCCATR